LPSPLSVRKNNYLENPKKSDIYTPEWLSKQIYNIITDNEAIKIGWVLDPAIGMGSLTKPFKEHGSRILGVDINPLSSEYCEDNMFICGKFEDVDKHLLTPELIICNPPFNSASGRKLYPEVFIRTIEKKYGNKIPVVMIVPMGFRLNQRISSGRWKYLKENWDITSIISLPIDAFPDVLFHSEVLIFNYSYWGLKSHYFIEKEDN